MNYKTIYIGELIKELTLEKEITISRICNFMDCTEKEVIQMYTMKSMDTDILLKWSKLLEYDFFRLYSQHLILYAPVGNINYNKNTKSNQSVLPSFRKNIYTKEVIDYILNKIEKGNMTKKEVIERYRIPKTTLYKWLHKYNK
ncbi:MULTISPECIES: transposase [Empedobacter]|uniref:Transposase n=2 Tax=Weeksellaceae TaxID=2762318 RepID=A0A7H9DW22_9FLAO|nr:MULTISPECIES: transposase [Empedobacter]HCC93954.1 transposase [Flavobacteriaceae bacterium]MDH2207097.1 transposase [Empedobacter sp. GD03644]MDM1548054.1 transposase [Empedobacter falsenii]MDM1552709.1 transposase [Empedobacter falsenii]QLL59382.1 transposase [Empedobacter falsenii]